jgi:hypothetical protein
MFGAKPASLPPRSAEQSVRLTSKPAVAVMGLHLRARLQDCFPLGYFRTG